MNRPSWPWLGLLLATVCGACGHSGRLGPSASLPAGEPANVCERRAWLELAPAEMRPGGTFVTYQGLGVFRADAARPEELERVFGRLQDAELQARNKARVEPVETRARRSLIWSLAGLGAMTAGLGAAVAIQDHNHAAANVVGISGLALGLTGAIVALVTMPSPEDAAEADARQVLFLDGDESPVELARSVDHANQLARDACAPRELAAP